MKISRAAAQGDNGAGEATNAVTLAYGSDPNHRISQDNDEEEGHRSDKYNSDQSIREPDDSSSSSSSSIDRKEILRAVEVAERESVAIADSFLSLFSSLRLVLSELSGHTVDHMHCFNDAAGHLQESALDVATKGNRYINSCLRLNEEMRSINTLAMHIKILRKNVDALDSAVNRLVRLH